MFAEHLFVIAYVGTGILMDSLNHFPFIFTFVLCKIIWYNQTAQFEYSNLELKLFETNLNICMPALCVSVHFLT